MLLSAYVAYAAGLATSIMTARALGPKEYGKYAYFVWLTGIIVVIFNNGITVTLIRFVSESVGEENFKLASDQERWLRKALWVSIAFVSSICLAGFQHLGLEINATSALSATIILIIAAIAKSIYIFDISKAKGYGEFNIEPWSSSTLSIVSALLTGLIFLLDGSVTYYLAVFLIISLIHPIIGKYLIKKAKINAHLNDSHYRPEKILVNHLYWSGLLCIVALSANRATETYLLNAYFSSSEVGMFIVAATLSRAGLDLVSVGLNAVLLPVLGHGRGSGGQLQVDQITRKAFRYMFFIGLMFSGSCYFVSEPLVSLLYGESFSDAALAFKVLVLTGGITLTSGVFGAYLSTTNQQKHRAVIAVLSAISQGLIAVIAVPHYGLWGAVVSTSIGGLLLLLLLFLNCIRIQKLTLPIKEVIKLSASFTSLMAVFYFICHNNPWKYAGVMSGLLFIMLFILASFCIKYWNKTDIEMLKAVFSDNSIGYKLCRYLERHSS